MICFSLIISCERSNFRVLTIAESIRGEDWASKIHLGPHLQVVSAAICSKMVILLLFSHCLLLLPLGFALLCWVHFCSVILGVLYNLAINWLRKGEVVDLFVLWLLMFSVSSPQCHGLVCCCCNSWSYSLEHYQIIYRPVHQIMTNV